MNRGTRQRWRKNRAQPGHADDWLMTYADVITLLLCFFAIAIITSIPKKQAQPITPPPPPIVQPQVQREEQTPPPVPTPELVEDKASALDIYPGNLPFRDEKPDADQTPAVPVEAAATAEAQAQTPQPESAPLAASLSDIADKSQGQAKLEQKGDRITTLEVNSAAFFGSGSATLSTAGATILRNVAVNLKSDKYKDYRITVEGHTDDTPIRTTQFPSNWELSTARAAAVVHFFLDQGVPAAQLRAAGYADTFPKAPNRDANGKAIAANQAMNRRVVIVLEKIDKSE